MCQHCMHTLNNETFFSCDKQGNARYVRWGFVPALVEKPELVLEKQTSQLFLQNILFTSDTTPQQRRSENPFRDLFFSSSCELNHNIKC